MTARRFRDAGESAYTFTGEMLVVCPRCAQCARIAVEGEENSLFTPRRLTCTACGLTRRWNEDSLALTTTAVDDYFGLPLWLQAPCCGRVLWAYNHEHLDLIARFVAAEQRERRRSDLGWNNYALTSRLPRWIKLASHRDDVLACIEKLRRERAVAERGGL